MAAYAAFTIITTAWRTKFRKQMNAADNKGATVAVDSLINYEAVKVPPPPSSLDPSLAGPDRCSTSTTKSLKSAATTPRSKTTRKPPSK